MRRRTRRASLVLVPLAALLLGTGAWTAAQAGAEPGAAVGTASVAAPAAGPATSASAAPTAAASAATASAATAELRATAAPAAPAAPAAGSALEALDRLPVKGRAPMTGYQRTDRFGAAWLDVDRNGCDTRNDVLRRDLVDEAGTRCRVERGVLHDPYTRTTIDLVRGDGTSAAVQIDHVVALGDAWRTGGQRLTQAQRIALANDPVNLFAVDGPTNAQKGDGDAATWLPPNRAFRCTYVAHQVGVKRAYGLWVTPAEQAAMRRVLERCPGTAAPNSTLAAGAGARTPSPSATPTRAAAAPSARVVSPGAYCSPAGASGRTAGGTRMVCRNSASDDRERWRSAA